MKQDSINAYTLSTVTLHSDYLPARAPYAPQWQCTSSSTQERPMDSDHIAIVPIGSFVRCVMGCASASGQQHMHTHTCARPAALHCRVKFSWAARSPIAHVVTHKTRHSQKLHRNQLGGHKSARAQLPSRPAHLHPINQPRATTRNELQHLSRHHHN